MNTKYSVSPARFHPATTLIASRGATPNICKQSHNKTNITTNPPSLTIVNIITFKDAKKTQASHQEEDATEHRLSQGFQQPTAKDYYIPTRYLYPFIFFFQVQSILKYLSLLDVF